MTAIGVPVQQRKLIVFAIASGIAGLAGALSAQTNQFVGLNVLSFELSGTVPIVLVLGGDDAGAGGRGNEDNISAANDGPLLLVGFATDRIELDTETLFRSDYARAH